MSEKINFEPEGQTFLHGLWKYAQASTGQGRETDFFRPEFDDAAWPEMAVPSNWFQQGLNWNGTVRFRKRFQVPERGEGARVWLAFQGVDYACRVWLNGRFLGEHVGYFEAFDFDVSALIRSGENLLAVEVTAPDDPGFPFAKQQFKGGLGHWDMRPGGWSVRGQERGSGGIWQAVALKASGCCAVKKVMAAPVREGDHWTLSLSVDLDSAAAREAAMAVELAPVGFAGESYRLSPTVFKLARGKNQWTARMEIADPALWWTWDQGEPRLYELVARVFADGVLSDEHRERIGFRAIEWRGDGLYVNGRRVYLRGACYISSLYLAEMTEARLREDLKLVREANLNALRVPYHLEPERFYELCDELGILVQAEFPMLWDYDTRPASRVEAARQVRAMVEKFHNRPAIFKWVCHCEPTNLSNRKMDRELARVAQAAERTGRMVDAASKISDHPFCGWYFASRLDFAGGPGGRLPSEFGAESLPGRESRLWKELGADAWPPNPRWEYHDYQPELSFRWQPRATLDELIASSQEYQARLLDFAIQSFRRMKGQKFGSFLFTWVDAWPSITWSILDVDRVPKAAYAAVAKAYQPLKLSLDLLETPPPHSLLTPLYWNDRFDQGANFFAKLWVIADRQESEDALIKWSIAGPEGELARGEKNYAVRPDSADVAVVVNQPLPADLAAGPYCLTAELFIGDTIRDQEALDFFIVPPGGRWKHAWLAMFRQFRDDLRHTRYFLSTFARHYLAWLRGGYRK